MGAIAWSPGLSAQTCQCQCCPRCSRTVASSQQFVVYSYPTGPSAQHVLDTVEEMYEQICRRLFGPECPRTCDAPCSIVLHGTRDSYARAVPNSLGSVGSTWIKMTGGKIVERRIDLLVDGNGPSALAHELTHLALAGYWNGTRPPRWLDEGLALLADGDEKQKRHWVDGATAIEFGCALRLRVLLDGSRVVSREQMPTFYGQSLSLVAFLLDHSTTPRQLIEFASRAEQIGYDRALYECYGIENIETLEAAWLAYLKNKTATDVSIASAVAPSQSSAE